MVADRRGGVDLATDAGEIRRLALADGTAAQLDSQSRFHATVRDDRRRLARLKAMAERADAPLLALNDVLYAGPEDRDLQDVLTCIREGATIETAGRRLEANAERWLKPVEEMARLFKDAPEAVAETTAFLSRATFDLSDL
ncbi:Error-prone DNA polymerase, partial [Friedmanniomyces endolithicus]